MLTTEQLNSLSTAFQNVYAVFHSSVMEKLTLAQAQAMDSSPVMLTLLSQQLAATGDGSIRLNVETGSKNSQGTIFIDQKRFDATANPGTLALTIAHEIGHTVDTQTSPTFSSDNPLAYADARAAREGYAIQKEFLVASDPSFQAANPAAKMSGGSQLFTQLSALGTESERVAAATEGLRTMRMTPSGESTSATYADVNVRDFVAAKLGISDPTLLNPVGLASSVAIDPNDSARWSITFAVAGSGGNGFALVKRTMDGTLSSQVFDSSGTAISGETTITSGQLAVMTTTDGNGVTSRRLDIPDLPAPAAEVLESEGEETLTLFDVQGNVVTREVTSIEADGSTTRQRFDGDDNLVSTSVSNVTDDGSTIETTTYADGRVTTVIRDGYDFLIQTQTVETDEEGVTTTTTYGAFGDLQTQDRQSIDGSGNSVDDMKWFGQDETELAETTTTVAPDGTKTISRDLDGNGDRDELETLYAAAANGDIVDNLEEFNDEGDPEFEATTTTHSDGSKTVFSDDFDGNTSTNEFDADDNQVSSDWQGADGSYGEWHFDEDGNYFEEDHYAGGSVWIDDEYADGSLYTFSDDGEGNTDEGYVFADGSSTDEVHHVDGFSEFDEHAADGSYSSTFSGQSEEEGDASSGVDTFNAQTGESTGHRGWSDGSFVDDIHELDGSYEHHESQQENIFNASYNAATGHSTSDYDYTDGSYGTFVSDSDGSSHQEDYAADESYVVHDVAANGSHSDLTVAADGSSYLDSFDAPTNVHVTRSDAADGSWSMTEQFLNEGTHLESFENADGSYGETMYEADGSYAGENHNADATYTTFFGQTGGYTETDYFDANDVKLRDTWVASSERSGNDIYNADGTIAGHIEEHITGDGWRVTEKLTQADEDYASRAITNLSGSLAFADTAYDASTGETAETYHDRDGDVSFLRVGLDGDERDGDGAGRWSYSSENFEDGSQEEEGIDASVASYHSQDSDARHTLTVSASADGTIIAGVVNPERLGFDGAFNEEGDQFGFNVAAPGAGLTHAGYYAGGLTIDLLDSVTGRQVHENGSASGGLYRQVEGVDGSAQDERFYENGVFGTGTFDVLDTYADGSTYSEHHNGTHFGYVDHAANGTSLSESREAQGDWVFNNSYILGEEEFASIAGTPGGSIQADLQIDEIRLHTVYNPTSTNASIWTQHLNAQGWVSDDNLTTAVFGQTDSDEWSSEDGSHGVAAVDALGNGHSETYSVDGSWWIGDWYIDGSFNASWSSGDETAYGSSVFDSSTGDSSTAYHYSDGSYGSSETASDGTLSREYHLANGDYGSVLSEADGHTHREDHWADGSSYSRDTYADGSFSYSTLAGDGDSETESYDAATGQNLRSYTYSDGGYGSLAIDGDGDISAEYHAADGSYATFAKSADGDRHAEYFDAVGDVSMVADIAANVDGSRTLSVTGADGTHEVAEYDADGELQASSWDREDGAHGEYARDGDGQWSGTAYEADGSYHVYSEQADGAWERDFFAADNTQTGNDWRDVDGTFGTHLDYADGGFYDLERDLDGNWTATVGRQDNTQTTTMYAAADGAATVIP